MSGARGDHPGMAASLIPIAGQALLAALYARALGELASTLLFVVALVGSAVAGHLAARGRLRTWAVLIIAAVAVAAARGALVGLASVMVAGRASVSLAALLQQFDAASIAALPLVALGFAGAVVRVRHPALSRWEPLLHGALLLALLWSQAHYELTYFARPWAYVLVVGLLLVSDVFQLADARLLDRRTTARISLLVVPIVAIAFMLASTWFSAGGTAAGGGILRPTLFRFDFAPFVRLESEITMSDDLVLLYRRSGRSRRELLRRYVLSDYDRSGGFSVADDASRPGPSVGEDPRAWEERELVEQEFFLVNLDPRTRLALNEPVDFLEFEQWDDSSFTSAYSARSMVSAAPPFRLARADPATMAPRELERLTNYGGNVELRSLALEITADVAGDFASARAIELYLQDNYFYSLRPGIAADGDQLSHFLFESRKGYCSYYAFSMTLMLRSLGIPARVAVGFFVDPSQEVLNFYPVLANMAHAWVEVYLGDYGWIEFDPTSQTLAPGEEYEFGAGADPQELASLLEEVLSQELRAAQATSVTPADAAARDGMPPLARTVIRYWYVTGPLLYLIYLALLRLLPRLRLLVARRPRERVVRRVRIVLSRLARWGIRRKADESLEEFGARAELPHARELMLSYERALFAPAVTAEEAREALARARLVERAVRRLVPLWRRFLGSLDPRLPHPAPRPGARSAGPTTRRSSGSVRLLLVFVGLAWVASPPAAAQQPPEWYEAEAAEAIQSERYDRAVRIFQEAQREYDERAEFFMGLGDLYYDEELYALALDEYLEAEAREPESYDVLEAIAFTLGLLNREAASADYWFRIADLYPQSIEPSQHLGWLLFKLHRLDEGRELALDAWDRFGPDADLAMTLGTIHAELYRFPEASEWYRRSIELASRNESDSFTAVAFYNLSLIQKLFHRYQEALESTEHSIKMLPRPTGFLARGELHELRMDFGDAHADYLRAYEMDDETPLARLNLALLYRRFGRLDEALAFATSVAEERDRSWLYYYGTDVRRHRMELHDLLADVHAGLSHAARFRVTAGPLSWVSRGWDVIRHRALAWYHRARFQSLAGAVAEQVMAGGNPIDGNWYLFRSQETRPRVATVFLDRARELEVRAIPESAPFYELEHALLVEDRPALLRLAASQDTRWRRHLQEEALVGALARSDPSATSVAAAVTLFQLNPGAFRQYGIRLPVRLLVEAHDFSDARTVRRMLARAGFEPVGDARPGIVAGLPELSVTVTSGRVRAELRAGETRLDADAPLEAPGRVALARAVNELAASVFLVQ